MSILVKIEENIYFSINYQQDIDFGHNIKKSWFRSKFTKISNLVKIFEKSRFGLKVSKILDFDRNLDKTAENVDYIQNFRKMSIRVNICKYLDSGQNYRRFRFWSIFMKISILVKIV